MMLNKPLSSNATFLQIRQEYASRNDEIRERYTQGETIQQLAEAFDLSKQRVHQIIHRRRK